jgi:hypothetical protein
MSVTELQARQIQELQAEVRRLKAALTTVVAVVEMLSIKEEERRRAAGPPSPPPPPPPYPPTPDDHPLPATQAGNYVVLSAGIASKHTKQLRNQRQLQQVLVLIL